MIGCASVAGHGMRQVSTLNIGSLDAAAGVALDVLGGRSAATWALQKFDPGMASPSMPLCRQVWQRVAAAVVMRPVGAVAGLSTLAVPMGLVAS